MPPYGPNFAWPVITQRLGRQATYGVFSLSLFAAWAPAFISQFCSFFPLWFSAVHEPMFANGWTHQSGSYHELLELRTASLRPCRSLFCSGNVQTDTPELLYQHRDMTVGLFTGERMPSLLQIVVYGSL